jgi:hypothetical protein
LSPERGHGSRAWPAIGRGISAAIASVVTLIGTDDWPFGWRLVLAVAVAVVVYFVTEWAVVGLQWLAGIPRRRRERCVEAVQETLRELDFRERVTPIVQRLRHLDGHGDHPSDEPQRPWAGFDAELADAEARALEPTRKVLREAGQPQLADQVRVEGSNLGPGDLGQELDRVLGVVEVFQNGSPDQVPFDC